MPQLNPSPWFMILIMSWTLIILFSTLKLSTLISLNLPTKKLPLKSILPWTWPWS